MSRSRLGLRIFLVSFAAFTCTAFAGAQSASSKISPDLAAASPSQTLPVIIQYRNSPSSLESFLLTLLGGLVTTTLGAINALGVKIPLSQLNQIAADPNVTYISLDRPVTAHQAVSISAAEYTTEPINAPAVWQKGYVGTNVGVAVIDSGITPVPDLSINSLSLSSLLPVGEPILTRLLSTLNESAPGSTGRIVYSQNFVAGQSDALDHFGHGTHVAGLIAGNGADSTGPENFRTFRGSAPNANIINLRVLDQNGAGTDSAVIAAIQQAISLKDTFNIRVINLSLGRPIFESYTLDPLCQA